MLKKIVLCLLLAGPAHAFDPGQDDKQKHMAASFVISTVTFAAARNGGLSRAESTAAALIVTLAVGAFKETQDEFFDRQDMAANFAGAIAAPILWWSF